MRAFALFVALLAVSLIVAAALAYPAWLLVGTIADLPMHRVMNRVAMLVTLIGLIVLTRRLGLSDRASLGYGLPRREFLRQLGIGWVCGIALMLPLAALLLGLHVRAPRPEIDGSLLGIVAGGIATGLVVAFTEETFFRGVLYTAVARASSVTTAIVAPSLLYASLHFLGGELQTPAHDVSWTDGFVVLGRLFERYTQPIGLLDSFVALAMLGVLFALVRRRTGAIAGCIGLHAAGVASIVMLRALTQVDHGSHYAGIVGTYDGVILALNRQLALR
jgi:uncharacterized protein